MYFKYKKYGCKRHLSIRMSEYSGLRKQNTFRSQAWITKRKILIFKKIIEKPGGKANLGRNVIKLALNIRHKMKETKLGPMTWSILLMLKVTYHWEPHNGNM